MPRTRRAQQSTDPGRAASAASSSHSRPASVVAPSDLFCTGHTRYDLTGRLTALTDGPRTITLGYDALGRRASLTHANGTQATYAYDLASRLTGLTHATSGGTPLQAFTYGYNAADARTSLTTLDQALTYSYDLANRLIGVAATPASPIPTETFTYDRVGNRLTGPDPAGTYGYNAGHQLLAGPGATYAHDANGNRTTKTAADGTTTYTWDARDRLVQAVVQTAAKTTTVTFAYDALGRRVRKIVAVTTGGATTTRTIDYVYDAEDVILAVETTDAGGTPTTVTTRYVHGPGIDEPLLVEQGGQVYAAHADALGSLTGLSDGSQTLAEASTYTSFGQLTQSGGVTGSAYAFTGRKWEPELGLSYYRARYYDPEAGRFLSRDPIGFAGGDTNLYSYVGGDPTNRIDPSGLRQFCNQYRSGTQTTMVCVDSFSPRSPAYFRLSELAPSEKEPGYPFGPYSQLPPGHYELLPRPPVGPGMERPKVIQPGFPVYTTPGMSPGTVVWDPSQPGREGWRGLPDSGPIGPHRGSISDGCPLFDPTEAGTAARNSFYNRFFMHWAYGGTDVWVVPVDF